MSSAARKIAAGEPSSPATPRPRAPRPRYLRDAGAAPVALEAGSGVDPDGPDPNDPRMQPFIRAVASHLARRIIAGNT